MAWDKDSYEAGLTPEQRARDRANNDAQGRALLEYAAAMGWLQQAAEAAEKRIANHSAPEQVKRIANGV